MECSEHSCIAEGFFFKKGTFVFCELYERIIAWLLIWKYTTKLYKMLNKDHKKVLLDIIMWYSVTYFGISNT